MTSGEGVSPHRNEEGRNMGAHVAAVGEQSHGVERQSANDLDHHHHGGEGQNPPGISFRGGKFAAELMPVLPS